MPKFRSVQGGHVKIIRQDQPSIPIDIDEGGSYETDDKAQIQALRDSPEVEEVKAVESKEKARS
jgi:hypothetical protein